MTAKKKRSSTKGASPLRRGENPDDHVRVVQADVVKPKRRTRTSKYENLIAAGRELVPGQAVLIPIPAGQDPEEFRNNIAAVVRRQVKPYLEEGRIVCRVTADDQIAVICKEDQDE
ncbi:MAG: hypothetical protein ACF8XB_06235 [Planctomycetota bacterium JB042]